MKVLYLDMDNLSYKEEDGESFGAISVSIEHHMKNKSYEEEVFSPKNSIVFSTGPFVGLDLSGAHRLIVSGRSPLIGTFFISTLGGGAIELSKAGINTIIVDGKANDKTIVLIKRIDGKLTVKFEKIDEIPSSVIGFQQYIIDQYSSFFEGKKYRALVVGRAAEHTKMGAIHSVNIVDNKIDYGSEGWAGRGGFGSLMVQAHNLCAVVFGGDYEFEKKLDVSSLFDKVFGEPMMKVITDATEKYRYVDKIKTGGTFGVNFFNEKDRTLMFNWQTTLMEKNKREKLYNYMIKDNLLKEFNDNIVKSRSFKTCGEICPAVCKKVWQKTKFDYEPSISCGPQCGVFKMDHLNFVLHTVEAMGFDAIEIGNLTSFVFEIVSKGLVDKEKFLMEKEPVVGEEISIEDSKRNSEIEAKLIRDIGEGRIPLLSNGIRSAAKRLGLVDYANYMSYGEEGVISPNQYWVPGFLIPLPIQGKFHTFYKKDFLKPYDLAVKAAERAVKELYSEECGICRFHRGWSEKLVPVLAKEYGLKEDMYDYSLELLRRIKEYDHLAGAEPRFYESKRTKEFIAAFVFNDESNLSNEWKTLFKNNFDSAIERYWKELKEGVDFVI